MGMNHFENKLEKVNVTITNNITKGVHEIFEKEKFKNMEFFRKKKIEEEMRFKRKIKIENEKIRMEKIRKIEMEKKRKIKIVEKEKLEKIEKIKKMKILEENAKNKKIKNKGNLKGNLNKK